MSSGADPSGSSSAPSDTVGSLLADIARKLQDVLRLLLFADKTHWGHDEHEQLQALREALEEAKKDFQEMAPLVHGQFYYENDRKESSLEELRHLRTKFEWHTQTFDEWLRAGGPINPIWIRETHSLRQELHRAQCRAASRIFTDAGPDNASGARCLGAYLVFRQQQKQAAEQRRRQREQHTRPAWQRREQGKGGQQGEGGRDEGDEQQCRWRQQDGGECPEHTDGARARGGPMEAEEGRGDPIAARRRGSLESLVPYCNAVGKFQRYGEQDVAFVCDFCDGFIIWDDLDSIPSKRTCATTSSGSTRPAPSSSSSERNQHPHWQATGRTVSLAPPPASAPPNARGAHVDKTVVFAPLVIANHMVPPPGDFISPILCPYCDEYTYHDQGDADEEELKYAQDERGFPDLETFQEHLEWSHTALPDVTSNCVVM